MHGRGWEFAVEEQWRALSHELAEGQPGVHLRHPGKFMRSIELRSPETSASSANYTLIKDDPFGSLHRRRTN